MFLEPSTLSPSQIIPVKESHILHMKNMCDKNDYYSHPKFHFKKSRVWATISASQVGVKKFIPISAHNLKCSFLAVITHCFLVLLSPVSHCLNKTWRWEGEHCLTIGGRFFFFFFYMPSRELGDKNYDTIFTEEKLGKVSEKQNKLYFKAKTQPDLLQALGSDIFH